MTEHDRDAREAHYEVLNWILGIFRNRTMSYEGFTQVLCANGHLREFDCWNSPMMFCPCCGKPFVWRHEVDETNCEGVRADLEIAVPEQREWCDMGHVHVTREVTYKIPKTNDAVNPIDSTT